MKKNWNGDSRRAKARSELFSKNGFAMKRMRIALDVEAKILHSSGFAKIFIL